MGGVRIDWLDSIHTVAQSLKSNKKTPHQHCEIKFNKNINSHTKQANKSDWHFPQQQQSLHKLDEHLIDLEKPLPTSQPTPIEIAVHNTVRKMCDGLHQPAPDKEQREHVAPSLLLSGISHPRQIQGHTKTTWTCSNHVPPFCLPHLHAHSSIFCSGGPEDKIETSTQIASARHLSFVLTHANFLRQNQNQKKSLNQNQNQQTLLTSYKPHKHSRHCQDQAIAPSWNSCTVQTTVPIPTTPFKK